MCGVVKCKHNLSVATFLWVWYSVQILVVENTVLATGLPPTSSVERVDLSSPAFSSPFGELVPPTPPWVTWRGWDVLSAPPEHLPAVPPAGHTAREPSGGRTVHPQVQTPILHTVFPRRWSCPGASGALEGHDVLVVLPGGTSAVHVRPRELVPAGTQPSIA